MSIARRLEWCLNAHSIPYEIVHHAPTQTPRDSARAAHVPEGRVAKCVLLEDERGYVLAIVPSCCRLDLKEIRRQLHRHLELASEPELTQIFHDCEAGAVPPIGRAYGIPTLLDDSLLRLPDLFFEAGDHGCVPRPVEK